MTEVVDDNTLQRRIEEVFRTVDIDTVSSRKIRKQLEEEFNCDLTNRKQFIDDELMRLLAAPPPKSGTFALLSHLLM